MKKQYDMTVKNIPSGLFTCLVDGEEIGIEEFSPYHISLRFSKEQNASCTTVQFAYFVFEQGKYEYLTVNDLHLVETDGKQFEFVYTYEIQKNDYAKMIYDITSQYERYIQLKMESFDNSFSKELVDYPACKDEEYASDFTKWKEERVKLYTQTDLLKRKIEQFHLELAFSLSNSIDYEKYLSDHWGYDMFLGTITRIYIGNAWCPHLFPDEFILKQIMDKARNDKKNITIVLSFLQDEWILVWEKKIQLIYDWCQKYDTEIEVIVNDYGELLMLQAMTDYFHVSFGTLLNKRRKDPRYQYKVGFQEKSELLYDNSIQDDFFIAFLHKHQINRIESESCSYHMNFINSKKLPTSLHLPLYQTNTSQYCTIYALCKNGDRGRQEYIKECPYYCKEYICLYPEHLSLIGRYNSVFAFDDWLVQHLDVIDEYITQGMDRIVWNI